MIQFAIREIGLFAFEPVELACCLSRKDAASIEDQLIASYATLHPAGFNSAAATAGGKRSADFKARHIAGIKKGLANLSPAQREQRTVNAKRASLRTREIWQDAERRPALLTQIRAAASKAKPKVSAAMKRVWADPLKRAAKLAQLRSARAHSTRQRRQKIRDSRQTDLI